MRVKNFHSLAYAVLKWKDIIEADEAKDYLTAIIKETNIIKNDYIAK